MSINELIALLHTKYDFTTQYVKQRDNQVSLSLDNMKAKNILKFIPQKEQIEL